MKRPIEQGLHEKLCAYILGEASDETRAEIEKALAESTELREERERIESTIGLVQATMGGSEELPPSAAREILAEAGPRRRRPWYSQTSFKMAAGLAGAALVGVISFRAMEGMTEAPFELASQEPKRERQSEGRERGFAKEQGNAPAPATTEFGEKLAFSNEAKKDKHVEEGGAATPEQTTPSYGAPVNTPPGLGLADGAARPLTVDSLVQIDLKTGYEWKAGTEPQLQVLRAEIDRSQATGGGNSSISTSNSIAIGSGGGPNARGAYGERKLEDNRPSGGVAGSVTQGYHGPGDSRPAGASSAPSSPALPAEVGARLGLLGYSGEESEPQAGFKGLGYVGEHGADDFRFQRAVDPPRFDEVHSLSLEDREKWLDLECRRIVERCRRRPNERPRDTFFRFWGDNAFEFAAMDPLSTFSVDVDTASYTLARRYLNEGQIPTKAQIRTEEFVNYFKADVAAPTNGVFAIHTDLTPSRFSSDKARSMLRVVVRGREIAKEERKPLRITFVIDTSGSMKEQNRLELVKHSMRLLANELGANDALSIVAFSSDARLILPMTPASQKGVIESAIYPLSPDGSTNAAAGLRMGYEEALAKIDSNAQNRVVLLSDGVANTGQTDQDEITKSVQLHREKGIYLNTIGVGMNNHNDVLLEQLADKGDGICSYVDSPEEARKAIVDRFTGAFETIARDVKIQVEFDPSQVQAYRLLGYENRAVADQDFRNDKIDAGEVGAGHQVTALYEIERTSAASEKPLATVRLRWKAPRNVNAPSANEEANEIARNVLAGQQTGFEGAGVGYRRAAVVAQFAEFLRRSVHARGDSLDDLIAEADKLVKETGDPETAEFVLLLHKSKQLILNALPVCDDLCQAIDAVRRNSLLRCQEELLAHQSNQGILDDIEAENRRLEERIRDLLRKKLEGQQR
ncbi:MAG: von Willebrand factor type A domain-containing protein [Planctomycetota bacterium]